MLEPAPVVGRRTRALAVLSMLALSAISALGGTLLMPDSYSWVSNVISESAAQGVSGAWLARLGFLLFGLAVLCLASGARAQWASGAILCHLAFGVLMVGTAAFSHRPWLPGVSYDAVEDALHSVTATGMGFAFSFAVVFRMLQRGQRERAGKAFDVTVIVAAVVLPMIGGWSPANAGWSQRVLFVLAYAWYGLETLRFGQTRSDGESDASERGA